MDLIQVYLCMTSYEKDLHNMFQTLLKSGLTEEEGNQLLSVERNRELGYEWMPANTDEFIKVVTCARPAILKDFGFVRYADLPMPYLHSITKVASLCGEVSELYLIAGEWYPVLPENFPLISIDGAPEHFKRGVTDSSERPGCLSYGVAVKF